MWRAFRFRDVMQRIVASHTFARVILLHMRKRKWAEEAIEKLQMGQTAQIRPEGHSMQPRINSGDLVTLEPCSAHDLAIGDVVLARITGRRYSHLVLHLVQDREMDRFLVGSRDGRTDGWIAAENIFGRVTKVERLKP